MAAIARDCYDGRPVYLRAPGRPAGTTPEIQIESQRKRTRRLAERAAVPYVEIYDVRDLALPRHCGDSSRRPNHRSGATLQP
jgi:hypothetical protein